MQKTSTPPIRSLVFGLAMLCSTLICAQKNVVQPGDPIIASSANSPGTEGVANAIDGKTTKYLNFDSGRDGTQIGTKPNGFSPSGFIVTPSVGLTRVIGMSIQSANDGPERDPDVVLLEGSNDATITNFNTGTWTAITTISNIAAAFTNRFQTQTFSFANLKPYSKYRWTVLSVRTTPNGCCMQVAEVGLLGSVVPDDVVQPGDPIIASSANSPGTEGVANAIDDKTTKYLNFDSGRDGTQIGTKPNGFSPSGFIVTPSIGRSLVTGISMQSANDGPERDPDIVMLEGSNDASITNYTSGTWETITTISNIASGFTARFQTQTFLFDNVKPYKSYRWTALAVRTTPNGCCMQVAEVSLLGGSAPQDVTQPGDPIIASSANSPGTEGVANVIDNKTTKYLNFDSGRDGTQIGTKPNGFSPSGFIVTPGIGASTVIGMTIQSANDGPERDPDIVLLEGSNDASITNFNSGTWTPITTISNIAAAFTNRFQTQEFFFQNNVSYTSYRWTALQVRTTPNGCCMQVAEVELLAAINVAPPSARFVSQPVDTAVLPGQSATFYTILNGPWPVQWLKNGVPIPGATKTTFTTEPITGANTNVYALQILGREASTPVRASVFTPSATKSVAVNFLGGGANGAPTAVNTNVVIGLFPQAYWNNASGGTGDLPGTDATTGDPIPLVNSDGAASSMTFNWTTTGTWGAGTGVDVPTDQMLNGLVTASTTTSAVLTFANVPDGAHSIIVYVVSPPLQFLSLNYKVNGTTEQNYYIRAMNSDEYNAAPGWYRGSSTNANARTVANYLLFENVHPAGGVITLTVDELAIGKTDRDAGVNGIQLLLNAAPVGVPPTITVAPQPTVVTNGGTATLTVTATGSNLTYQWRKNGKNLPNGANVSGATSSTLTIGSFSDADAGIYSVAVFNAGGSALSANASVGASTFNIKDSLAAYFKFDSSTGSTATNSVSGGLNGTVNGTATWKAGKIGNALSLDGNTYLVVTNYPKASKQISASAWVNIDPASSAAVAIVRNAEGGLTTGGGLAGQFELGLTADATDGSLHLSAAIGAGPNIVRATDPAVFKLGTWQNVAFTADGAQLRLYNNGALVASTDYLAPINPPNIAYLTVGAQLATDAGTGVLGLDGTNPNTLTGQVDDLAVWNRALSSTEVGLLYTAGNTAQALDTVIVPLPVDNSPPSLKVTRTGTSITITWTGGGTLQSADAVTPAAGYTNVTGVTGSTYTTTATGKAKFYRVSK